MKKIIAILLTLALVFSLAACGGEETPTGNENGEGSSNATDGTYTDGGNGGGSVSDTGNGSDTSGGNGGSSNGNGDSSNGNGNSSNGNGNSSNSNGNSGSNPGVVTGLGYEADRKLNKSGAVSVVDSLNNTYYKISIDKTECR